MIKEKLLKELKIKQIDCELSEIHCVDWRAENSIKHSVLFYNMQDEDIDKCEERLLSSSFKICFVNTQQEISIKNTYFIEESDFFNLQELFLEMLYPLEPSLVFFGVTGTNGKTTTVDILRQVCLKNKKNILSFGTLGTFYNDELLENLNLTTPNYIDLRKTISKVQSKTDIVVMELSSHALEQQRSGRIKFDCIGWTSFSQDHLDYHKTMKKYLSAKLKVFSILKPGAKVLIPKENKALKETLSSRNFLKVVEEVSWDCSHMKNPFFSISYNQENLSIALGMLKKILDLLESNFEFITPAPGRFDITAYRKSYIIIDYAHTPCAIESICREVKKHYKGKKLITVFGCGGDRDRKKRPLMAKAVDRYSDVVILTMDNPRTEDPSQIMADTEVALSKGYRAISSRPEAIKFALNMLSDEILLILGKGHERSIEIMGEKYPHNDKDFVLEIIND